jgi:hypothetical protein
MIFGLSVLFTFACTSNGSKPSATNLAARDAGNSQDSGDKLPANDSGEVISTSDADIGPTMKLPCSGSDVYCSKRYDELCYAATHNSAASSTIAWQFPSQSQSIRAQLDNGIRALMLSVQTKDNLDLVCYGDCAQGNAVLSTVLGVIRDFLTSNPREVVTLLIDSQISAAKLQSDLTSASLDSFAFTPVLGQPWPTLGELIDLKRRLVVFANTPDTGPDWLLARGVNVWETAANWASPITMTCGAAIGNTSLPFGLVHHYIAEDNGDASTSYTSTQVNDIALVVARLSRCIEEHGRVPNFVAVDYFEAGDVVGATQVINGIRKL